MEFSINTISFKKCCVSCGLCTVIHYGQTEKQLHSGNMKGLEKERIKAQWSLFEHKKA